MADVPVTWLGHASFRLDTPGGKRVYVDPWLGNPKCPDSEKEPERVDVIALTHGHGDHVGETVELSKKFEPEIVALVELKGWLGQQGANVGELPERPTLVRLGEPERTMSVTMLSELVILPGAVSSASMFDHFANHIS